MEEGTIQDPAAESETPPTNPPGLPADDLEITLASGDTVTYGELKQGYIRTEDYTVKTQEAAEMKREADEQMAEAAAVKADADGNLQQADNIRKAVDSDIAWYKANPDTSTWAAHELEVNKAMGVDTPVPASAAPAPVAAPPVADPELAAKVERLEKTENERAVDALMSEVSTVAGSSGNELVTQKLLLNAVRIHQSDNKGVIPTAAEVATLATEIQKDLVDQGIPVPQGTIPQNGSSKASFNSGSTVEVDPAYKNLNLKKEKGKVLDAVSGMMRELASRKG